MSQNDSSNLEASLHVIRAALVEGERSGDPVDFNFDDYIAEKRLAVRTEMPTP